MDELELHRCKLLHTINETQSQSDAQEASREPQKLSALKEEYNRIVFQIEEANTLSLCDPVEKLPVELWQDIIRECCHDWREWISGAINVDQLLMFTLVSKKWSAAILSSPILWSELFVFKGVEDLEAKVVTCLALSADLPLYLNFVLPIPLGSEALRILRGESHRIRAARYMGVTVAASVEDGQRLVNEFMASMGHFPSLEVFIYDEDEPNLNLDDTLNHAASIQMLHGVKLLQSHLAKETMRNLHSIFTEEPFSALFESLYLLPFLKTVTFRDSTLHLSDRPPSQWTAKSNPTKHIPWLRFSLLQRYVGDFSAILNSLAATLLELDVLVFWGDLEQFLLACGHLGQLRRLRIELPDDTFGIKFSQPDNVYATNIRQLNISLGKHPWESYITTPNNKELLGHNIRHFFEVLPLLGPQVNCVSITTYVHSTPFFLFTQQMPHLASLSLRGYTSGSFQPFEILLPTVEYVYISGTESPAARIYCPNAIRLETRHIKVTDMKLNDWQSIQHLEIGYQEPDWESISLPYLQTLVINLDFRSRLDYSKIFWTLAVHPTSFPCLTQIRTNEVPEWDILFIMLERRNFLPDKSIARIKLIGLPALPHIAVLRPLSNRLRGLFSDRPSNYLLSTQGSASTYLDRNVHGCHFCHRSFLPCRTLPYGVAPKAPATRITLPIYPDTADEILSTHSARQTAWSVAVRESGTRRYDRCESSYICPTDITGYTSIGLPITLVSSF